MVADAVIGRGQEIFDHIWVTSRGLAEYREYFQLTSQDLDLAILDCPAGAAGFAAQVNSRGGRVVAADIAYQQPMALVESRARADLAATTDVHLNNPDLFTNGIFATVDQLVDDRSQALEDFLTDRVLHPNHYVAACLPDLPFPDDSFDLVLSPYLLFCYGDRLDVEFHRRSIRELLRVTRSEVRMTPLCEADGSISPWRDSLLQEFGEVADVSVISGIRSTHRGAGQTAVVRKSR